MAENQTPAPPPIQPPANPAPPFAPPPVPNPESQSRMWCMFCHLSALSGLVIPFGNILGPLILWQIKKNEFPAVDAHGKAALNFQITVLIAGLVTLAVVWVGMFFCLGLLLLPVPILIFLAGMIFPIIAGIKANNGEDFKYPCSLELLK